MFTPDKWEYLRLAVAIIIMLGIARWLWKKGDELTWGEENEEG